MIEPEKNRNKRATQIPNDQFSFPSSRPNSRMLIFFRGNNQIFQDQVFFFIPIWQSRRKIQEHTFFLCLYCGKNPNFLIYVVKTNQERKKSRNKRHKLKDITCD
jgi:hypothetical protein